MRRRIQPKRCALLLAAMLAIPASSLYAAEDPLAAGRALAQKLYDRPDGRDMSAKGQMILEEQGREPRVRVMYSYRLDKAGGEVWSLIRFTSPADIDGVGLLTLDHPGDASDQWVYLPELDRSRRVASNRKGGRFVGSDLFYEDIQDREVSMDRHRLVGRETLQGVSCEVLESTPVDPANSVYGKRISWIHPQSLVALRVDLYTPGREQPSKRFTVQRLEKVQGYWSVMESTMADLDSGHQTRLKVERLVYDRNLPETLFTQQMLEDPAREAASRP